MVYQPAIILLDEYGFGYVIAGYFGEMLAPDDGNGIWTAEECHEFAFAGEEPFFLLILNAQFRKARRGELSFQAWGEIARMTRIVHITGSIHQVIHDGG